VTPLNLFMRPLLMSMLLAAAIPGCTTPGQRARSPEAPQAPGLDAAAEQYVKLVLALGEHDAHYVDAYHGPQAWAEEAKASRLPLQEIGARAAQLVKDVQAHTVPEEPLVRLRHSYLLRQLGALKARVRMLEGERLSFDEESEALYGARAPHHDEAYFQRLLEALGKALPGEGTVDERLNRFRADFVIPPERRDAVFRAAIEEARRRTLAHIPLPEGESFTVEFVSGKPWSAYNWFKGGARSLIQVNTDQPLQAWRAIDLAAHEGYPGHHVYNTLLEQRLVRERGWVEFTVYPLFSPQSLIAEGSGNYGIRVAFPEPEVFLREVLFPLAGLPAERARTYVEVERLAGRLSYAGNEAARGYLDGTLTREQARDWLMRYALMSPGRAEQRMAFIDTYRSYVINYNLGEDLVRAWVERQGGDDANPERRWELFRQLISSPMLPADLR
jgi:hypothetical protein